MSAYVVEREHIAYLIEAARSYRVNKCGIFSWYYNQESKYINQQDLSAIGAMLWNENIRSVAYRYPDNMSNLPGPIGAAPYDYGRHDLMWSKIDPVQVFKSCNCYEYQCCGHPDWENSEAYAFIGALRQAMIKNLEGYDDAKWGAPEPTGTIFYKA